MSFHKNFAILATLTASLYLGVSGATLANKSDDTVNIAFAKELDNPNTYFSSARESTIFGYAVWDTLVERDPKTREWVGNLAESFKWVDDLTLEFKLRQGVKFHNGDAFGADDVVFTLNHFSDPKTPVAMPNTVAWIKNAEKVDDQTVLVHLKAPFPAALDFLESAIQIYPAKYYQEVGDEGFSKKPVGTGPYMVDKIEPGTGYTLKAFPDYHDGGPRQKPQIKNVEVRSIPDTNTQIAEMMSGSVDFIWQVPEDLIQKLKTRDSFNVVQGETLRFGYISMDVSGRSSADTPLKDVRVRHAINHAIDRKAVRDAFFTPSSQLINSICSPLQFGCEQDVTSYNFDPAKAKELLKEAGFENGFTTTMYFYRDKAATEAMAQMLGNVGVKVDLQMLKYAALADKQLKGQVPMGFVTWGSGSVADASASTSKFFDGSDIDDVKNADLTATLKQADTTTDPEKRKEFYSKALRQIADQAYWVPLWSYTTNYVLAKDLNFTPTPDEFVRFYDMSWN